MGASDDVWLSEPELAFLRELEIRGVRYLVVGMSAAILQGVPGTTQDVDLWFESLGDARIGEAAHAAGGFWATRMSPPMLGGALGERFDVVTQMSGIENFAAEYAHAIVQDLAGQHLHVLPLERVAASKRAAGRPKDLLAVRLIEETLAIAAHPAVKR
jgi:hypothetical protein